MWHLEDADIDMEQCRLECLQRVAEAILPAVSSKIQSRIEFVQLGIVLNTIGLQYEL